MMENLSCLVWSSTCGLEVVLGLGRCVCCAVWLVGEVLGMSCLDGRQEPLRNQSLGENHWRGRT